MRLLTTCAALAACLLAPAAAPAVTTATFDVDYDLEVTLQHGVVRSGGGGSDESASFRVVGTIAGVQLAADHVLLDGGDQTVRAISGAKGSYVNRAANGAISDGCSLRGVTALGGAPAQLVAATDPAAPQERLALIALAPFTLDYDCAHDWGPDGPMSRTINAFFDVNGQRRAAGLVGYLPRPSLEEERTTVTVHDPAPDEQCFGYRPGDTCAVTIAGTATFTRTAIERDPDDDLLAPLVSEDAELDRKARKATAKVTCRSACGVRIRIFPEPGRRGGRPRARGAAVRPVAQRTVQLPASDRAVPVTVRLRPAARRAVLAAGAARLVLDVTPDGGAPVRREVVARVR